MRYERLSDNELGRLARAGEVQLTPSSIENLNQILMLWLTAEDENDRIRLMINLSDALLKLTKPIEAFLYEDNGYMQELHRRIRKVLPHNDALSELLNIALMLNGVLPGLLVSASRGPPRHDWLAPYFAMLLVEHKQLGGSDALPPNGADHEEADTPRYNFVLEFVTIFQTRVFSSSEDPGNPASEPLRNFTKLAAKRGSALTKFLRNRCLKQFSNFPHGFSEATLSLHTEGFQSEFRDIVTRPAQANEPQRSPDKSTFEGLAARTYLERKANGDTEN